MPNRFVGALALTLICTAAAFVPASEAQKKSRDAIIELGKFQGTWKFISAELDGEALPKSGEMQTITFDGAKFTIKLGDKVIQTGTQKVDPGENPKAIDAEITQGEWRGTTQLGIYEFQGDALKVCFDPSGQKRPTEFKTTAGSRYSLASYKEHRVIREGIDPKDPSIDYDKPHQMISGAKSYNGWAYDKTALCIDAKTKLVLPIKDTVLRKHDLTDVVHIYMEKRMHFGFHIDRCVSIVEERGHMGCAVKLEKGELLIGTVGEFSFPEGACTMKLLVLVPPKAEISRRDGLIGARPRIIKGTPPPPLISPDPGAAIPALTKQKEGSLNCWLQPTVEDGWHEIPAVADVERRAITPRPVGKK